jgi:hypothetical protein
LPVIFGGNFTFDGQKGGMERQGRPFGLFSPKEMAAGLARIKKKHKNSLKYREPRSRRGRNVEGLKGQTRAMSALSFLR